MPITIRDGIANVPQLASANHGGKLRARAVVMHYTASASAAGAIAWLRTPAAKASAHFVIDQKGAITQLVSTRLIAWHAGTSSWVFANGDRVVGLNGCSIGIELVNEGPVTNAHGKFIGSRSYASSEILLASHKFEPDHVRAWPKYPVEQVAAAAELVRALRHAGEAPAGCELLGHDDIAPGRKFDPGPAFPWDDFRTLCNVL